MISLEAGLSLVGGFVVGAGTIVFAIGKIVGAVLTRLDILATAIGTLNTNVSHLSDRLHELEVKHAVTRTRLDSVHDIFDSDPPARESES